jgi:hypothetical protein
MNDTPPDPSACAEYFWLHHPLPIAQLLFCFFQEKANGKQGFPQEFLLLLQHNRVLSRHEHVVHLIREHTKKNS